MDEHANDLPEKCPKPWDPDVLHDYEELDTDDKRRVFMFYNGYDQAHEPKAKELFPDLLSPQEQDRYEEERREQKREKREKLFEKKYHKVMFWIAVATLLASVLGLFKGCDLF